jgi:hypothetical protein
MRALEIIWKIFFYSFSSLFQVLLCEAFGWYFWDVRTVILYVQTVILVVRMIWVFRPDAHGSCPNGRVFAISYVAPRPDVNYVPSGR